MHYEYLVIISPPYPVSSSIMTMKYQCEAYCSWSSAVKSKPHITVSHFIQPVSMEKIIINRYTRLAAAASPFKICLSGFGYFSPHTLFVKLTDKEEICDLAKYIKWFTKPIFKKVPNYPPHFMSEPHVTIAKDISKDELNKVWSMWAKKEYYAEFDASQIQLLRRPLSNIWQSYDNIGTFSFTGSGIVDPQLKLF